MFLCVDFEMGIILHSAVAHRPVLQYAIKKMVACARLWVVTRAKHMPPRAKFSNKTPSQDQRRNSTLSLIVVMAIIFSNLGRRHDNTGPPTDPEKSAPKINLLLLFPEC